MKQKLLLILLFAFFGQIIQSQTHPHIYSGSTANSDNLNPSFTLTNFSTCQTSASLTANGYNWAGISSVKYAIEVNGVTIDSNLNGITVIDLAPYMPVVSVRLKSDSSTSYWLDMNATVTIDSPIASMPPQGPTVSDAAVCEVLFPYTLTAGLNSGATTLKWYGAPTGGSPSFTAPIINSIGVYTYYVSQADAVGCESIRVPITINAPTAMPVGPSPQMICDLATSTLADINVTGTSLIWYADATTTTQLPLATPLSDGTVYYVSQTLNGCESPRLAITVVKENVNPIAIAQPITVQLDATGNVTITPAQINNGSTDNCSIDIMSLDVTSFDCSHVGTPQTVTLTVTDTAGNSSTATATVTVEDVTAPVITCVSQELMINGSFESGNFSGWTLINNPSPLYGYTVSTTSSNVYFTNPSPTEGTYFASNGFDGAAVGTAVLYQDITIPTGVSVNLSWDENIDFDLATYCAGCLNRIHQVQIRDLSNNVLEVAHEVIALPEVIDNDNIWNSYSVDLSTYSGQTIRVAFWQNITNVSTGPGKYALDNVSLRQSPVFQLDAVGVVTIAADDLIVSAADACSTHTVTVAGQPNVSFDCSQIGVNSVQVDVTDEEGNVASCIADISIMDTVVPTIVTQDITVQLDATGNVTIAPADINNGSTDNCAINTIALDVTSFSCANLGDNTVTLTVTDVNGNTATGTATVTVEDTIMPTAIAQNITVQLDATGNATISAADIDNGSTDNCAIDTMSIDVTSFDCSHIGVPQAVVLTVTDTSGNFSIANAAVTVEDTVPPVVVVQDISVVLDASGNVTITPADIDNGSTDNCGIATIELTHTDFDFNDVGSNTIGLIVTDIHGNVSTATAIVTVPLTCPGDITVNNDAGICGANVIYNAPGRKDILILAAALTPGDMADVQQKVTAAGNFNSVDTYDAFTGTPTLAELKQYDAVLLWGNAHAFNEIALGNVLAQYIDNGGGVVDACFDNASIPVLGAYNTPAYRVLEPAAQTQGAVRTLGTVALPAHPIMDGVTTFNGGTNSFHSTSTTITPGSYIVASYDNSAPFIVAKENAGALNARRVSLNFFPVSFDVRTDCWVTSTDGALIMANALKWTAFGDTVEQIAGLPSNSQFPLGDTTNTYEYTDELGNVQTCSFVVTVEDNELPVVLTQDITVQLDAAGNVTVTPAQIDNSSTDNCTIDTLALDITTFDCTNVGTNTVVLTVTDISGNSATGTAVVTVEDNVVPVVITQDITVQLDATGNVSITPAQIDNGSADACGIDTITLDVVDFTCANVGPNTVTLTVTDVNGNVAAGTATVTVEDTVLPLAFTQDITVSLASNGRVVVTPAQIDNGSIDNCAIATMTLDITTFDCDDIGDHIVTLTVTDVNGNSMAATATVTVIDDQLPMITTAVVPVQPVTLVSMGRQSTYSNVSLNGSGVNYAAVNAGDTVTFSYDYTAGYVAGGACPGCVTQHYVGLNGNFDDCHSADGGAGSVNTTFTAPAAPGIYYITQTGTWWYSCYQFGTPGFNDADASAAIAVLFVDAPSCPADVVQDNDLGICGAVVNTIDAMALDNCAVSLAYDITGATIASGTGNANGTLFNEGTSTVTYTATDATGNTYSCSFDVTINDVELPIVVIQDITVQLDAAGNVSISPTQIDNGSTDNCTIDTMVLDITTFDCTNVGDNTVTLTVTDVNGNVSTNTAVVTVEDNVAPTVITQDITVQLDATGNAAITTTDIDNGSTDNCTIDTMVLDITAFNCTNVGDNTVTLTVTDVNGNVSTATAVVTVEDSIAPTVITQDITVQLDATGNAVITTADINNGSTDNCTIDTMVLDITAFDCTNVGDNTVTLTVTDVNGNVSTNTAVVTVEDSIVPTVITQDITVQLDATGNVSISPTQIDNGSTDNCTIDTMVLDITAFNCTNVGDNTVTLTVTDVNGNVSNNTAVVTVEDNVAPTVITQDITVQLDATGNAAITTADIDNGSTDNCTIDTMVLDITAFNCTNMGDNTVTLTVTDVNGNVSTNTAIVTVEDNIAPIVLTQDITVQLDATGNAAIATANIDNGSTDNCAIDTMVLDITAFDCTNVGDNTVVLTVTDVNGNISTNTAVVTVEDNIAPVVVTQDITIQLDDAGSASITITDIEVSSTDACGVDTRELDITEFDCTNVGDNTIILTVTDVNGNVTTATAVVTIEDAIAPVVQTQDIVVQLDITGNVIITPTQIDNGSADNCSIDTLTLDITEFDCTNVGDNTVVLTVTDASGNSSTGTAVVTVQDVTPPVLSLQNATIQLGPNGTATLTFADIDTGSFDNCAIATVVFSQSEFICSDAGNNFVTVTVTDVNGLVSTANVNIMVVDLLPPVAIAQNLTVGLGPQGTALVFPPMVDNGSYDNCQIQALILSKELFTCEDIGVNTVMFTVVDIYDNATSVSVQITIEDTMAPVVDTFPVIVQLGADGTVSITPEQVNHGSTDNCGIASMSLDVSTFDCDDIGNNTVILTVTDIHGNSGTAEGLVVVQDVLPATVVTQPVTVALDENGQASIVAADVEGGTTDNCGIQLLHIDVTNFTCEDLGVNQVKLTAYDTAGNSSWAMAEVTVVDTIAPVAITQDIVVSLGLDGTVTITPEQINDGSTDNCAIDSSVLDITTFDCSNIGDNVVTLTVSDASGNTNTAEAIVTIKPVAPPIATSLSQGFCVADVPTVGDIAVNNPATVAWYAEADGTEPLDINIPLVDGTTYYAATNLGGCESELRIAVTVSVKDVEAPSGEPIQYFCIENDNTLADIVLNQQDVVWYSTPTGGTPLDPRTPLVSGYHYYAAQVGPQCEGLQRLRVTTLIHYCDIKVNNAVSANNDGKNDYLSIEGIEYFEDNSVEIFNRWGSKVFETTHYGINGNYFKGYPNSGVGSSETTLLPFGTYYYVIQFVDHYGNSQTKTGYLHLNH